MAWTQANLDAVEAAINARIAGGAVNSYGVGGRNLQYMKLEELRALRHEMAAEIQRALYPTGTALAKLNRAG
jgi:hypothetical protein